MIFCTLKSSFQFFAFTVEYDKLVTYCTDHNRRVSIRTFDSREWEPADLLIELFTICCKCARIPGSAKQHTCCFLIH